MQLLLLLLGSCLMVHDGLTLLQVSLVVPRLVLFGYKLLHPASTEHQALLPQHSVCTSLFSAGQGQTAGWALLRELNHKSTI